MKWWKSVAFSILSLVAVILVSIATLVKTNVISLDVASSPVFASPNTFVNSVSDTSYEDAVKSLDQLGIELSTTPSVLTGRFSYTSPEHNSVDLLKGAKMLSEEFSKYSNQTIKATGLKKIYLVKDLSVNGQPRSGMPDPTLEDALYFDISSTYITSENSAYMRRTFHHEFKHLIDYNIYGSYQGDSSNWTSCNLAGVLYGNGGSAMYNNPEFAHSIHPQDGFVNGYATSGIEEDRAEVYAELMTTPEELQNIANKDSQVACKVAATRQLQRQL